MGMQETTIGEIRLWPIIRIVGGLVAEQAAWMDARMPRIDRFWIDIKRVGDSLMIRLEALDHFGWRLEIFHFPSAASV
jgi:hypothetical protein